MNVLQVLEHYRTFNPGAWVSVYRNLPTWAGLLCVVLGLVLLLFGGGRAFRLVAGPAGALAGYLWAPLVAQGLGLTAPPGTVAAVSAVALGVGGFVFPPVTLFFALGLPAGLIAAGAAGSADWILAFAPTLLIVGAVAAVGSRYISALVASAVGAWIFVLGTLAALHQFGGIVTAVASQPWGVILAAVLFALAGAIYQILVRPSPEVAENQRIEKARAKRRLQEKEAIEKRWANYRVDEE